ncbi:MAG: DNA polymerase III subunit beta [Thermoanaerobaculia bacterium]
MHFLVSRDILRKELSIAQSVVEKKTTIPILVNVLLKVEGGFLKIVATDLDVTYHSRVPVEVKKEGSATVMASKLSEIFSLLPDGDVEVNLKDHGKLHIGAQNVNYDLSVLPEEDYPKVPYVEEKRGIEVDFKMLQDGLLRTLPSVSMEEYRYQLGGVCFKVEEKNLELASTDGHRLSRVVIKCKIKDKYTFEESIIPRKACAELARLDGEETVIICNFDQFSAFILNERQIIARKLQAKFPDYKNYLMDRGDKTFTIERSKLYDAVRRVSVISLGKYYGIRFLLTKGKLVLDGSHPDIGEAIEQLEVDYSGEQFQITFNAKYLIDFLSTLSDTTIEVYFKDMKAKATFIPKEENIDHIYILMPMTV